MDKYKINFISGEEDINNIFVKVLDKELKEYILKVYKNQKCDISLSTNLPLERGKNC